MAEIVFKEESYRIMGACVELHELANEHRAQVHHYLNATGYNLGLIVNLGHHPQLEWER